MKKFEKTDIDIGRETELVMARLQPYDGTTVYGIQDDGSEFMGYELKPFDLRNRKGTTITKHSRMVCKTCDSHEVHPELKSCEHYVMDRDGNIFRESEYFADDFIEEEIRRGTSQRARAFWGEK